MDLTQEIIVLLNRAKESGDYYNPHFLSEIEDALAGMGIELNEDLEKWIQNMWSR